jgi:uncharacterized protein YggE
MKTDRLIKKFLEKLSEKKVVPLEVEIGDVKLKPSFQFNRDLKTNVPSDFLASRGLDVVLEDANDIGKVMDACLSVGSFLLESARLTVRDKSDLEARTFGKALEEARKKAEGNAKSMGAKLGAAASVEEIDSGVEEINVIQNTDFALLLASNLKEDSKAEEAKGNESDQPEPGQDGKGYFAFPEGASSGNAKPKMTAETRVQARCKIRVTFFAE